MAKPKLVKVDIDYIREQASILESTFDAFGIRTKVAEVNNLGTKIEYRLKIAEGTKLSHFRTRQSDIALAMSSPTGKVEVEAPIPGTNMVGITVPIPKAIQTKKKKSYEVITITKEVKVSEYSMAELLRDTTFKLFKVISKYSDTLAERIYLVGRKKQD